MFILNQKTENSTTEKSLADTSNDFGAHDTLRYGFRSIANELVSAHPLEERLAQWDQNQLDMKLQMERRVFGLHAPLRTLMERELITKLHYSPLGRNSNTALDILDGKDEFIDFEDFLNDPECTSNMYDIHATFEKNM